MMEKSLKWKCEKQLKQIVGYTEEKVGGCFMWRLNNLKMKSVAKDLGYLSVCVKHNVPAYFSNIRQKHPSCISS